MDYLQLIMAGALPRILWRVSRGRSDASIVADMREAYPLAHVGDIVTLLDVARQGQQSAATLATLPRTVILASVPAPFLPTVREGEVMIEGVVRIPSVAGLPSHGPGSRPIYQFLRHSLPEQLSFVDWVDVVEQALANNLARYGVKEQVTDVEITPTFMAGGG